MTGIIPVIFSTTRRAPCRNFANSLPPSSFRKRRWRYVGELMQERQVTGTAIGGLDSALGMRRPSPLALSRKDEDPAPVSLGTVKPWSNQKATPSPKRDDHQKNIKRRTKPQCI